jgi:hypothetical protein
VSHIILETLSVVLIDHDDLKHCRSPFFPAGLVSDLSNLVRVQELALPFRPSTDILKDKLSPSLEKLGLLCTNALSPISLEYILQHRLEYGAFSRVDIFVLSKADVDVNHVAWEMFKKAGVAVLSGCDSLRLGRRPTFVSLEAGSEGTRNTFVLRL